MVVISRDPEGEDGGTRLPRNRRWKSRIFELRRRVEAKEKREPRRMEDGNVDF